MKRAWVALLPLLVAALSGAPQDAAQTGGANYTKMRIDQAANMEWEPGRRLHITGGFDITLMTDNPGAPGLRLRAEEALFSYSEKGSAPSKSR